MLTLNEIRDEYIHLIEHMEYIHEYDQDEEKKDKEFLSEELMKIEDTFDNKVIAIGGVIKSLEAEQSAIADEIARLTRRFDAKQKTICWLRDYLLTNMKLLNKSKVESPLYNITVRTNPHKVNIVDDKLLPEQYKNKITIERIDKLELLQNLKAGEIIPGAELIQIKRIDIR